MMTKQELKVRKLIEQEVKSLIKEKKLKGKVVTSKPDIYQLALDNPDQPVRVPTSLMNMGHAFFVAFTENFGPSDKNSSLAKVMGYNIEEPPEITDTIPLKQLVEIMVVNGLKAEDYFTILPRPGSGGQGLDFIGADGAPREQLKEQVTNNVAVPCKKDADCEGVLGMPLCLGSGTQKYCSPKSKRYGRPGGKPAADAPEGTCSDGFKSAAGPSSRYDGFDFFNSRCWSNDSILDGIFRDAGFTKLSTVQDFIKRQSDKTTAIIDPLDAVNALLAPGNNAIDILGQLPDGSNKDFQPYIDVLKLIKPHVMPGKMKMIGAAPGYYPAASEEVGAPDLSDEGWATGTTWTQDADTIARGIRRFADHWFAALNPWGGTHGFSDEGGLTSTQSWDQIEKNIKTGAKECKSNSECPEGQTCVGLEKDDDKVTTPGSCAETFLLVSDAGWAKFGRGLKALGFTVITYWMMPIPRFARTALKDTPLKGMGRIGGPLMPDAAYDFATYLSRESIEGGKSTFRTVAQAFNFVVGQTFRGAKSGILNRAGVAESDAKIGIVEAAGFSLDAKVHIIRGTTQTGLPGSADAGARSQKDQWDILEQIIDDYRYTPKNLQKELTSGGMGFGVQRPEVSPKAPEAEVVGEISFLDIKIPAESVIRFINEKNLSKDQADALRNFFGIAEGSGAAVLPGARRSVNANATKTREYVTFRQLIDESRTSGSNLSGLLDEADILSIFSAFVGGRKIRDRVRFIHQTRLSTQSGQRLVRLHAYIAAYQGQLGGSQGAVAFLNECAVLAKWSHFLELYRQHRPGASIEAARRDFVAFEGLSPEKYIPEQRQSRGVEGPNWNEGRPFLLESFEESVTVAFGQGGALQRYFDPKTTRFEIPGYTFKRTGWAYNPANREILIHQTKEERLANQVEGEKAQLSIEEMGPYRVYQDITSPSGAKQRLSKWLVDREIKMFYREGGRSGQFADSYYDTFFSMGWLIGPESHRGGFRFDGPLAQAYRGSRADAAKARAGERMNTAREDYWWDEFEVPGMFSSTNNVYAAAAQRSFQRRTAKLRGAERTIQVARQSHRESIEIEILTSARSLIELARIVDDVKRVLGIDHSSSISAHHGWAGTPARFADDWSQIWNNLTPEVQKLADGYNFNVSNGEMFKKQIIQTEKHLHVFDGRYVGSLRPIVDRASVDVIPMSSDVGLEARIVQSTAAAYEKYLMRMHNRVKANVISDGGYAGWYNQLSDADRAIISESIQSPNQLPVLHDHFPTLQRDDGKLKVVNRELDGDGLGGPIPSAFDVLQTSDQIAHQLNFANQASSPAAQNAKPWIFEPQTGNLMSREGRLREVSGNLEANRGGWSGDVTPGSSVERVRHSMEEHASVYATDGRYERGFSRESELDFLQALHQDPTKTRVVDVEGSGAVAIRRMLPTSQILSGLETASRSRTWVVRPIYEALAEYPVGTRYSGLPDVRSPEARAYIEFLNGEMQVGRISNLDELRVAFIAGPKEGRSFDLIESLRDVNLNKKGNALLSDRLGASTQGKLGDILDEAALIDDFYSSLFIHFNDFLVEYSSKKMLIPKRGKTAVDMEDLYRMFLDSGHYKRWEKTGIMSYVDGDALRTTLNGDTAASAATKEIAVIHDSVNTNAAQYARLSDAHAQQVYRGARKNNIPEGAPIGASTDNFGGYRLAGIPAGSGGRLGRAYRSSVAAGGAVAGQVAKATPRILGGVGKVGGSWLIASEFYYLLSHMMGHQNIELEDFSRSSEYYKSAESGDAYDLVVQTMLNDGKYPASLQKFNRKAQRPMTKDAEWLAKGDIGSRLKHNPELLNRWEKGMKVLTFLRLVNTPEFKDVKAQHRIIAEQGWGKEWIPQIELKAFKLTDEEIEYDRKVQACILDQLENHSGEQADIEAACGEKKIPEPAPIDVSDREDCEMGMEKDPAGCMWHFRLPTKIKSRSRVINLIEWGKAGGPFRGSEADPGWTRWYRFNDERVFGPQSWEFDQSVLNGFLVNHSQNPAQSAKILKMLGQSEFRRYIPSVFAATDSWQSIPRFQTALYALQSDPRAAACFASIRRKEMVARKKACFHSLAEKLVILSRVDATMGALDASKGKQLGKQKFDALGGKDQVILPDEKGWDHLQAAVEFLAIVFEVAQSDVDKVLNSFKALEPASVEYVDSDQTPEEKPEEKPEEEPEPEPEPERRRRRRRRRRRQDPVQPPGRACVYADDCAPNEDCISVGGVKRCRPVQQNENVQHGDELFAAVREALIELMQDQDMRKKIYKESLKIKKDS